MEARRRDAEVGDQRVARPRRTARCPASRRGARRRGDARSRARSRSARDRRGRAPAPTVRSFTSTSASEPPARYGMTMNTTLRRLAVVDDRADVRMHELARRLRLAPEALAHLRVAREVRVQHLDHERPLEQLRARRSRRSPCRRCRGGGSRDSGCPLARRSALSSSSGRSTRRVRDLGELGRASRAARRAARDSRCRSRDRTRQAPNCMRTKSYGGQGPVHSSCISRSRFCSSRTMSLNASQRSRSIRNDARAAGPDSPA